MKSPSVRTRLTLWNVGVLALALLVFGLAISYSARKSLVASIDRDLRVRASRLASRVGQFLSDNRAERGIVVQGVEKGAPKLVIPGIREPVAMFQTGPGEFEGVRNPQPSPANDPGRSPFRSRILRMDGRTSGGETPYDSAAFGKAKSGWLGFSDVSVETEPGHYEPARLISVPVLRDGKVIRVLQYPVPLAGTYTALADITSTLLLILPLILAAATVGGFFLTGRALKPVREITRTAANVSAESLDGRLEVKGSDEFSRLAETFNGMLGRLQGAFARMEELVQTQRRFIADASHELRTPLTVIKANTSLAMKGQRSTEEYQKTIAAVNSAADTMGKLVNDLLLLARSDDGRLEPNMEPVPLKPILCDAAAAVARPGVTPVEVVPDSDKLTVLGDRHALTRVFVNLLENAVHYTPPAGSVRLTSRCENGTAVVEVADTGSGIPEEHLPHLLDRFYRVDKARARSEGGSGLGLAICASIVEAHGGTIEIDSAVGKGTRVRVRLPLATSEA